MIAQHVVDAHQRAMRHGENGFLLATATRDAVVERGQIGVGRMRDRPGNLAQDGTQLGVALARLAAQALAAALWCCPDTRRPTTPSAWPRGSGSCRRRSRPRWRSQPLERRRAASRPSAPPRRTGLAPAQSRPSTAPVALPKSRCAPGYGGSAPGAARSPAPPARGSRRPASRAAVRGPTPPAPPRPAPSRPAPPSCSPRIAASMSRPLVPTMSVATTASVTLALSSTLCKRLASCARSWTSVLR